MIVTDNPIEVIESAKNAAAAIPAYIAQVVFWMKLGALLLAVSVSVIVLYFVGPSVAKGARWLFGEQSEILDGISHGGRLLAWMGIVMLGIFVWRGGQSGDLPGFWEKIETLLAKATEQLNTEPTKEKRK